MAIAAMFRQSIDVGRTFVSPRETTGRFSGTPPPSQTPFATERAMSLRWALQGVRSDAVFAIAICGRPRKAESGTPRRIHARWMYELRSLPPYHWDERSSRIAVSRAARDGGVRRNGAQRG